MRGFVGSSSSRNIEEAINEASSGLKTADLLILTAPYDIAEKAAELLSEKYPGIPMIGCTGQGINGVNINSTGITLVAFAGVTVTTGLVENVTKTPVLSMNQLENAVSTIGPVNGDTICMEFVTQKEEKVVSTMNTVLNRFNIPLIGASSHGTPLGCKHMVIKDGKVYYESCVYAIVKNNNGLIHLFKQNIYERLSKKPHFATVADPNTKALFQLDGVPAFEIYQEEVCCEREEVVSRMPFNPLGRALGDETIITSTASLDMNNIMFNGKALYENDSVYIMKLGNYKKIHHEFITEISEQCKKASFVYGFESTNRIQLFNEKNFTTNYLAGLNTIAPYAAHIGVGMQFINQHMNQTLLCAVFE